jgi:dolichol-phosphate mannosyltransferase
MTEDNNAKKMLVILPTYNESSNIARMVEAVKSLNIQASILIIDDNSPDGTGRIADELSGKYKDVFVIHRERKLGLGSAYVKGFKFALERQFDYICEMDADFSHDPKYLIDFYREIQMYDLVTASRYMNGISIVDWGLFRLLSSFFANKFVKFFTGMPFSDCMGGFKCFRAEVIQDIDPDNIISKGYVFQMEMLYRVFRKRYRIKEVPIIFYNRKLGKSKMDRAEMLESFFLVIYLRFLLGFKAFFNRREV